jgi:hypothetical protein
MRTTTRLALLCIGMLYAASTLAQQPPAGAPAGTTGLCNDATYWSGATKKGACHGHKGVKEWYGSASAATPATPAAGAAATAHAAATAPAPVTGPAPAAPSAPAATSAPTTHATAKTASTPATAPAPGGGPGQVWVNHPSKVYHCQGDRWYGKTKDGEYMTEAAATAAGYRPDHGKACK